MKRFIVLLVFVLVIVGLGIFALKNTVLKAAAAGLQVKAIPGGSVYINDKKVGQTPFEDKQLSAGEITLKIVPDSIVGSNTSSWEAKVKLTSGTQTIISREFGATDGASAGETITLEKIPDSKTASLAVISFPESAMIQINGESKGFSPFSADKQDAGEKEIKVSSSGYLDRTVRVQLILGFKLVLNMKLAESKTETEMVSSGTPTPTGKPSPTPTTTKRSTATSSATLKKPYVTIKDTPTGWLRVRIEPSKDATEAAKVSPGESFPFLDQKSGWYQIRYAPGKDGWVSGQYAEKFE